MRDFIPPEGSIVRYLDDSCRQMKVGNYSGEAGGRINWWYPKQAAAIAYSKAGKSKKKK